MSYAPNEITPERLGGLLDWIASIGSTNHYIIVLPAGSDEGDCWMVLGGILDSVSSKGLRTSGHAGVSTTCGAVDIQTRDNDDNHVRFYFYTTPGDPE